MAAGGLLAGGMVVQLLRWARRVQAENALTSDEYGAINRAATAKQMDCIRVSPPVMGGTKGGDTRE
jgi:hypothetical protein